MIQIREVTVLASKDDNTIVTSFYEEGWRVHKIEPVYATKQDEFNTDKYKTYISSWKVILVSNTTTEFVDTFLYHANYGFDHQQKAIARPFINAWHKIKDNFRSIKNTIKYR